MSARTMFDKVWEAHVIEHLPAGVELLHIDRHFLHELTGAEAIRAIEKRGIAVRSPELTFATLDHVISTEPDAPDTHPMMDQLREQTSRLGIVRFDIADSRQGIVHVVGPEQGLSLPGTTIVCGDSHTCTHGAFGAMAWGIGTTEQSHVLATQSLRQARPKTMRIQLSGEPAQGASAKDVILFAASRLGVSAAAGFALEFDGPYIRALDMEGRMTICNLAVELGARFGMIAPDQTTYDYLLGRPYSPGEHAFEQAMAQWRLLPTDAGARFDKEIVLDVSGVGAMVTWGINPGQAIAMHETVPDPAQASDEQTRSGIVDALEYMRLSPGQSCNGLKIDRVFIGSCANGRISDLRAAAQIAKGRRVAQGVKAWVVPGSIEVRQQAEAEGLHSIFLNAGFEWRSPGCSMCVGANGDIVQPGQRCVSTTNRNFIGRQGPGALTHLASPATAAASAIAGHIADPAQYRELA